MTGLAASVLDPRQQFSCVSVVLPAVLPSPKTRCLPPSNSDVSLFVGLAASVLDPRQQFSCLSVVLAAVSAPEPLAARRPALYDAMLRYVKTVGSCLYSQLDQAIPAGAGATGCAMYNAMLRHDMSTRLPAWMEAAGHAQAFRCAADQEPLLPAARSYTISSSCWAGLVCRQLPPAAVGRVASLQILPFPTARAGAHDGLNGSEEQFVLLSAWSPRSPLHAVR